MPPIALIKATTVTYDAAAINSSSGTISREQGTLEASGCRVFLLSLPPLARLAVNHTSATGFLSVSLTETRNPTLGIRLIFIDVAAAHPWSFSNEPSENRPLVYENKAEAGAERFLRDRPYRPLRSLVARFLLKRTASVIFDFY